MTGPRYDNDRLADLVVKNKTDLEAAVEIRIETTEGRTVRTLTLELSGGETRSFDAVDALSESSVVSAELDGRAADRIDVSSRPGPVVAFVRDGVSLVPLTAQARPAKPVSSAVRPRPGVSVGRTWRDGASNGSGCLSRCS